jgi:hypothetical protein
MPTASGFTQSKNLTDFSGFFLVLFLAMIPIGKKVENNARAFWKMQCPQDQALRFSKCYANSSAL